MCKASIRLQCSDKILSFLSDIEHIDGNINFETGRYLVSARSIMNIFTLDLSNDLVITYDGSNYEQFNKVMSKYMK